MSEIAALRQQIELECLAMHQALHGPAIVSTHAIIAQRFAAIGLHKQQLGAVVGEHEAARITYQTYVQVIDAHA